jgi:3-hydroxyacyl-CoA dehydrogenase
VLGRISSTTLLEDGAKNTDLVIEAIVENIEAKHSLFSQLDKIAPK